MRSAAAFTLDIPAQQVVRAFNHTSHGVHEEYQSCLQVLQHGQVHST